MSNSPLIRTAVNLCLIAAMVIQPMVLASAHASCAQGGSGGACCQGKTVCHSCKCCKVKLDGDLCGCCSGTEDGAGDGCTKKGKTERDDLFGEIADVVPEPPGAVAERAEGKASISSCMCGIRSEPIAPAPHRGPVPQGRELVVIAYLDQVASETGMSVRPNDMSSQLPIGDHSPHFAQRFLCIWRI